MAGKLRPAGQPLRHLARRARLAGAQPGDAVPYNLNSSGTYADHVGIVTSIDSGGAWVVSGNFRDGVDKHRAQDAGVISGYVTPTPA
jgi:hypothetical protein